MITLEELREKARLKRLSLGNAEKDYLLSLLLLSVSRRTKDELVFKGGTALYKFYGLNRFSEDADFSAVKDIDHGKLSACISSDMKAFGVDCALKSMREPYNSVVMAFSCRGPLYKGTPLSSSGVRLDINKKSSVDSEPENRYYSPLYTEIPGFSLLVMQEPEIAAEKIRAIMTRMKARDVYDLWFLLRKGIKLDKALVTKKLAYYGHAWDAAAFISRVAAVQAVWEKELARLLPEVPRFVEVKEFIGSAAETWKL
ncbi:MAG: nucleotidyl transferase AbiEii/AbiGii toxin family protein [Candidatus Aenigmarchaeota archaeon]|nr:nucleotidyl transferase AbiEii/AbiGii toxin family protein [Candidatus Aenigmarchaeota archaeon]